LANDPSNPGFKSLNTLQKCTPRAFAEAMQLLQRCIALFLCVAKTTHPVLDINER
jgi:hypothetical protein